jgi:hypothetical protein
VSRVCGALPLLPLHDKGVVGDLREQAFRRHYARIYRYLRRRTGSDEEAEELDATTPRD